MTIDELLDSGWQRHAEHPTEVAEQLESHADLVIEPAKAQAYLGLSNHTIGEHLADWGRAESLALRVVNGLPQVGEMSAAWMALAVAHLLSGNWNGALSRQADIIRLGADSATVVQIRLAVQAAKGLTGAGRLEDGKNLYAATLLLARAKSEPASDRTVAIVSNNLASDLLELKSRSAHQSELMLTAADAAAEFWSRCGTWVHRERALYLLALVHNASAQPDLARSHAEKALELIAKSDGEEKVDEAFIHLALADSFGQIGERGPHEHHLQEADALAGAFPDDAGLKAWFAGTRSKVLWPAMDPAAPAQY